MSAAPHLEVAAAIGRRLARDAIWAEDRCTWLGWDLGGPPERPQAVWRVAGPALGDGSAGIALFLAELAAATGERLIAQAARGALSHVASRLGDWPGPAQSGLFTGIPGACLALARAGEALDEPRWQEQADRALTNLSRRKPDPERFHIHDGEAGAALVLLDAGVRMGRDVLVRAAMARGEALVSGARRDGDVASWPSAPAPALVHEDLVGYPLGAGGVALTLLELHSAGGEDAFSTVGLAGFAYEAARFDAMRGLWPDLRVSPQTPTLGAAEAARWPVAWLHGAAGIALARLRLRVLAPRRTETEIELQASLAAVAATLSPAALPFMNCSVATGVAGNAEVLSHAATALGRADLTAIAAAAAVDGAARYAAQRIPWPCGGLPAGERPDLLFGLAGIGRFYLRLHEPARARNLLLIEPARREDAPANDAVPEIAAATRAAAPPGSTRATSAPEPAPVPKPEPGPGPAPQEEPADDAKPLDDPRAGRRRRRKLSDEPAKPRYPADAESAAPVRSRARRKPKDTPRK